MTREWELYDLHADPNELNNVYGQPGYQDIQTNLTDELARLRKHFQVPDKDPDIVLANGIVVTSDGVVIPGPNGER